MQQQSRTPPFQDAARRNPYVRRQEAGWPGRWSVWRLVLTLVGVLLLGGFVAGIAIFFQRPSSAGGILGSEYQVLALQMPAAGVIGAGQSGSYGTTRQATTHRQREFSGDTREYMLSNPRLLLSGRWSSMIRFHPASFPMETDILNMTVICDAPADRDTSMVYSEPTWVCKNIRVISQNKSAAGGAAEERIQRLPFSDTTSRTFEEMIMARQKELMGSSWSASSDACGQLPDRKENVLLLCEMLLAGLLRSQRPAEDGEALGSEGGLGKAAAGPSASSVHIPFGNCSLPDEKRILLVGMTTGDAVWYTEKNWKPGFVTDLFCSFSV